MEKGGEEQKQQSKTKKQNPRPRTERGATENSTTNSSKHLSKDNGKSVQAVAVDNGATSKKIGRGGNLVIKKDHPTSPISLHAAPSERSGLRRDLGNWQTPRKSREAREVGLHRASP